MFITKKHLSRRTFLRAFLRAHVDPVAIDQSREQGEQSGGNVAGLHRPASQTLQIQQIGGDDLVGGARRVACLLAGEAADPLEAVLPVGPGPVQHRGRNRSGAGGGVLRVQDPEEGREVRACEASTLAA